MKTTLSIAIAALFSLVLLGCQTTTEPATEKPAETVAQPALTAEGNKYEPPIKVADVPSGAWYCDMGTSHYARSEKGDGKCPLCKMDLKEKAK